MNRRTCLTWSLLVVGFWGAAAPAAQAAESLKTVLEKGKWDRIVGHWVDASTKGKKLDVTYAWKLKDRVIEVTSKEGAKQTVALIALDAKKGSVFQVGADNQGGSSIGTFEMKGETVTLGLAYTTGNAMSGVLSMQYRLQDDDTLLLSVMIPGLARPIEYKLIRAK